MVEAPWLWHAIARICPRCSFWIDDDSPQNIVLWASPRGRAGAVQHYSQIKIQTLIIKPPAPVLRPKVRFDLIALLPLVFVAHQLKI
jgi:hypothetical protein